MVDMGKNMPFLSRILNSVLDIEKKKEETSNNHIVNMESILMFSKWVGFDHLTFSMRKGASLKNTDKGGSATLINPWIGSVTLAQSLDLTFSPKATFKFLFEKGLLENMTKLWPLLTKNVQYLMMS